MSEHEEVERILEQSRVKTTPEQDARILGAVGIAVRPPVLWKRVIGLAAALLLLGVVGTLSFSGLPAENPADDSEIALRRGFLREAADMKTDSVPGEPGNAGRGWARLEDGEASPSTKDVVSPPGMSKSPDPTLVSASNLEILRGEILAAGGATGKGATGYYLMTSGGLGGGHRTGGAVLSRYLRELQRGDGYRAPPEENPGNTEAYDVIAENRFESPWTKPQSTLSIDVDTASYANVRRFLTEGRLPPPGAVRIEELINYFTYGYPQPMGETPFSVTTEVAVCPWNPKNRLVLVGLQGRRIDETDVPPRNLVFLLDVSGSMQPQNKLPLVKAAMKLLVERLREQDRVAIVVYAGSSGVVLEPTTGSSKGAILEAIDALNARGSTNGAQGIRLAYDLARRHLDAEAINRVILATDGDFNVGTTSRDELKRLIEKEREGGIFLTVLGVGTGNIKDSQMEMLADCGNGNYAYLDSIREAQKVLVREAGSTLVTIAKDVKIQIEWNPHRVGAYRLIGYENRLLAARDFNDDTKDAGEIGAGHSVTALYEITPPGEAADTGDVPPLRYQGRGDASPAAFDNEIMTLSLRYKEPTGTTSRLLEESLRDPGHVVYERATESLRFASAVAGFGLALRDSKFKGDASFGLVHELASTALGDDPDGDRAEFLRLAAKAGELSGRK